MSARAGTPLPPLEPPLTQQSGWLGSRRVRRGGRNWLMRFPRAAPIGIFLAILAITGLSVFAIEKGVEQRDLAKARESAQVVASALDRRGNTNSSYLRAGAALTAVADDVDLPLFRRFVTELRLDGDFRGSDGIGWAAALTPDEVEAFEAGLSEQVRAPVSIRPAVSSDARAVVPVTYLEPDTERNRRAIAFDMYSEEVRKAAMDEAVRMVRPTASGKIVLVQEGGSDAPGFLIYMPVFDDSADGRKLRGFVFSPLNAQDFLQTAVELAGVRGVGVRLYDTDKAPENLLADIGNIEDASHTVLQSLSIANRAFALEVRTRQPDALSPLSMATLLFGLAVASLLMLLARLLTQQAVEDENSLNRYAEQVSIRDSLTRELNHRVKNTLANVLSIISLTRRRTDNIDEFADGLQGRIRAISATHALLTESEWGTTPIRSVVEAEIAPYVSGVTSSVTLDGPQVELAPNDALSLGLAIHELSTNAAKFGALSTPSGSVEVTWGLIEDRLAEVQWVERGGPAVPTLRDRGFGTDLLEKIVAHELKHPVDLVFEPDGVRCTLRVPVRQREDFKLRREAL